MSTPNIVSQEEWFKTRKELLAFRERMNWSFSWVSSADSEFNRDFGVSFTEDEVNDGIVQYNYGDFEFPHAGELPGISVFVKQGDKVYRSYSSSAVWKTPWRRTTTLT